MAGGEGNKALFLFVAFLCVYFYLGQAEAYFPVSNSQNGKVTWYDANGTGACSYDYANPSTLLIAAARDWNGAAVCGNCLEIVANGKKVVVKIQDRCPDCGEKSFDLSQYAFSQLATPSTGVVNACWTWVSCDVTGGIQYWIKEGSSQWWFQIMIANQRVPVAKLEVKGTGQSTFTNLPKTDYNYFNGEVMGTVTLPITVRVTATNGEVITDTISNLASGGSVMKIQSTKQFVGNGYTGTNTCGAVGSTPTRTRTKTKSKSRSKSRASSSRTRTRSKTRTKTRTRTRSRTKTKYFTQSRTRTRTPTRTRTRTPTRTRTATRKA